MAIGNRGFTLFEALIAALILTIVASGIAGTYVLESGLSLQTAHRLEAVNYMRAAAAAISGIVKQSDEPWDLPQLSPGVHTSATDPDICSLPDSYFKLELKGQLQYVVEEITVGEVVARRIQITIEWKEKFPKNETKREELYIIPAFFHSWWSGYQW